MTAHVKVVATKSELNSDEIYLTDDFSSPESKVLFLARLTERDADRILRVRYSILTDGADFWKIVSYRIKAPKNIGRNRVQPRS